MKRSLTTMALIGALTTAVAPGGAASTQAGPDRPTGVQTAFNGVCEVNELCLYANSNCLGSFVDFWGDVPDFGPYRFPPIDGAPGRPVKGTAASARNMDSNWNADIFAGTAFSGPRDRIPPRSGCRNLINTYKNNSSFRWAI